MLLMSTYHFLWQGSPIVYFTIFCPTNFISPFTPFIQLTHLPQYGLMKWYDDLLMFSHIILEIPNEIGTLVGEYFD
jgi:hypothetical protein